MFQPKVISPDPDPNFVCELRRIDPDLRVRWGYEQYFVNQWAIELKIDPERYFKSYASLFDSDHPRFVDQPIFDTNQPEYDEYGDQIGFRIVGYRRYDLAPEYEWLMFAPSLDQRVLLELRRIYAWNQNHWITRAKFEQEQREKREADQAKKRLDCAMDALPEVWHETGKVVMGKPIKESAV